MISNLVNQINCLNYIDGLVQERRRSIANALELRLSCTNPTICTYEHCIIVSFSTYLQQDVYMNIVWLVPIGFDIDIKLEALSDFWYHICILIGTLWGVCHWGCVTRRLCLDWLGIIEIWYYLGKNNMILFQWCSYNLRLNLSLRK